MEEIQVPRCPGLFLHGNHHDMFFIHASISSPHVVSHCIHTYASLCAINMNDPLLHICMLTHGIPPFLHSLQSWGISRMQLLRDPLKPVLLKACKFVQRKELTEALVFLGMMEEGEEGVPAGDKTEVLCLPSTGGVRM